MSRELSRSRFRTVTDNEKPDYRMCSDCFVARERAWAKYERMKGTGRKGFLPFCVWWLLFAAAGFTSPFLLPIVGILWLMFGRDTRPKPPSPRVPQDDAWPLDFRR